MYHFYIKAAIAKFFQPVTPVPTSNQFSHSEDVGSTFFGNDG
jgi:hypothetical protein